ncbi:hypothetical protein P7C71_g4625, partial [Lecanoromycetidae sp. Uapishka_2]
MSEAQQPIQDTSAALPPAVEPTAPMTTASEATADPVRSQESSTLLPESRPELGSGITDGTTAAAPTGPNVTNPHKEEKLGKGETMIESNPINEGILNYKGPGLKQVYPFRGLIFSKKYFWFSDAPLEHKHLSAYLGNEKAKDIAHPNAAQATQTGKGLLFSAKRAEDKDHPQHIFNLADVTDVEKGNFNDFSFKLHGKTHTFQALSKAEKDGWLVAIETKLADAKSAREGIVSSSGYKGTPAAGATTGTTRSLSRPGKASKSRDRMAKTTTTTDPVVDSNTATAAGTTSENTPETVAEKTHHNETGEVAAGTAAVGAAGAVAAHRNGSISDEDKKIKKSRSQSRNKRTSLFGNLLGKKEDHETKKEIKKEEKEEKKEEKAEEKIEKKELKAEEKAEKKEEKAELKAEKKELKEEKKEEKLGEKEGNPLSTGHTHGMNAHAIAPEADTVGASDGLAEEGVAGTAPVTATELNSATAAGTTPATATKQNKRSSVFGSLFGKKDAASPGATETSPAVPPKDEPSTVSSAAPQLDNPVAESTSAPTLETRETPAAVADTATPTTTTPSNNRRSSFFSNLGTKKEKRAGATSGDELTDGEGKKSGGFGGLLRKASRAQPKSSAANTTQPLPTATGTTTDGAADMEEPTTTADVPSAMAESHEQTPVSAAA